MPFGTIALVGGGRMGEAILAGLIASGGSTAADILVAEPDEGRRAVLTSAHGVKCVPEGREAVAGADVIVLAVKPQAMSEVVSALSDALPPDALVVSIAAGMTCAKLEAMLAPGTRVVRVIPNAPAMVREGMAVVSAGSTAGDDDLELVVGMFSALGKAIVLDERYQDAATAISGSGPAYMALFVDALIAAGEREGLPREVACTLAVQTMRGSAELLERTGQDPKGLIDAVSSPGGTTIAALGAMERGGFSETVADGVSAAVARAKELGS